MPEHSRLQHSQGVSREMNGIFFVYKKFEIVKYIQYNKNDNKNMGAKVSGNYEELTDKGYNTVGEKELKDFYNRKQAEIEERKIKNTNLRQEQGGMLCENIF